MSLVGDQLHAMENHVLLEFVAQLQVEKDASVVSLAAKPQWHTSLVSA